MSDTTFTCPECGRTESMELKRRNHWGKVCNPCAKRLGRANNAAWVERDREASRQWKERNRERNRAYDRARYKARQVAP